MNRMTDKKFKDDIKKIVRKYQGPLIIGGSLLGLRLYYKRQLKKEYIKGCFAGFNMTIDFFDNAMNVGLRQLWNDYKLVHPGTVLKVKLNK